MSGVPPAYLPLMVWPFLSSRMSARAGHASPSTARAKANLVRCFMGIEDCGPSLGDRHRAERGHFRRDGVVDEESELVLYLEELGGPQGRERRADLRVVLF